MVHIEIESDIKPDYEGYKKNDDKKIEEIERNRGNNLKGKNFEELILNGCKHYKNIDAAVIDRVPEPFRVLRKYKDGTFTGRFTGHALPDFIGTLATGRTIMFEAKRTDSHKINKNVLTAKQLETLKANYCMNGVSGVCACIKDRYFFIPYHLWSNMEWLFGRKYLLPDDMLDFEVFEVDGELHFLENDNMFKFL